MSLVAQAFGYNIIYQLKTRSSTLVASGNGDRGPGVGILVGSDDLK